MTSEMLIGVDIGTQGVKGVLYDPEGECLASAFRASKLRRPDAVTVEEDPEHQLASSCRVIRGCVRKAGIEPAAVAAIAFDGQMAGVIGVGRDGRNVTPYDSWLDTRCGPQIERMQRAAGEEILTRTGCPPSFNHGPKILRWKEKFRRTYGDIRAFVQPAGYVAMRLCGLDGSRAFIDKTYLHFSGFADNRRSRWDVGLCRRFGIDPAKLPAIVDSHSVVGQLTRAGAGRCGLGAGVPVVAGCGDTAASFLACGATREGVCVDVAGTASVFASTAAAFRPDVKHRTLACGRAATPGLWHPYAYVNGGGMNLEWFRRELANNGRTRGRSLVGLEQLSEMAGQLAPADDDPMFVPHLGGRVCPSHPALRGAWVGLSWNHTLPHLYRAVLEGVALEYGVYLAVLRELYPRLKLKEVRITGGGEKSEPWNRMKADALGVPVVRIARSGGAPMGAALLAGYGVGLFKDISRAANSWTQKGTAYRPRRKMAARYRKRLARYRVLLEYLTELSE